VLALRARSCARFAGRGPGTVDCCIVDTVLHKCHSPLRGPGAALAASRLGGRRAVARLLWVPRGSSMPIVRDPPTPLIHIGVPIDHPLDLDLDIQP
jgi:hypothetical protein